MTEQGDTIRNVCFCFSGSPSSYYRHPLVALASVFENTNAKVRAHILCGESVTDANREAFASLAKRYGQEAFCYDVPAIAQSILENVPACFGKGALYRAFLPALLSESLVLYLDCDVICTMDIEDIFSVHMGVMPVAGVQDTGQLRDAASRKRLLGLGIEPEKYINTGVMLCNLDVLRKECPDYADAVFRGIAEEKSRYAEQDALNLYFQKKGFTISILPESCNYQLGITDRAWREPSEYAGKILHYVCDKPWEALFPAAMEYWKYYSLVFSCQEAFAGMASLGRHKYMHLYGFLLRKPWMRRMLGRGWQIEQEGIGEMLLDRLFPRRRKQKKNKERRKGA